MKKEPSTPLNINPEVWKEAKIESIRQNVTLAEAVEEALKQWLKNKREANADVVKNLVEPFQNQNSPSDYLCNSL